MRPLQWSQSHAVFVTEIDDEHREIFEALSNLQSALSGGVSSPEAGDLTRILIESIVKHFAHEERLMRAARYESLRWHKQLHDTARKRAVQFVRRIQKGDWKAGSELVDYLTPWLHDHTRLADQMLGAFLRNHRRVYTVTFRAGTKPAPTRAPGCIQPE